MPGKGLKSLVSVIKYGTKIYLNYSIKTHHDCLLTVLLQYRFVYWNSTFGNTFSIQITKLAHYFALHLYMYKSSLVEHLAAECKIVITTLPEKHCWNGDQWE